MEKKMTELRIVPNVQGKREERVYEPRPLVDLLPLAEEETPALAGLSDAAFRLLVDMILSAHIDGEGVVSVRGFHPAFAPRSFETPAAVAELVEADLISPAYCKNEAGELEGNGAYFVHLWEEMTNASAL